MLDQADYIASHDTGKTLEVVAGQPAQLGLDFAAAASSVRATDVRSVVVAGMGGSALAAAFVQTWLKSWLPVPLEIARSYDLPGYVNAQTLVVLSSYSGNTEETLSALAAADKAGAQIVVIASGGKLGEAAGQKHYPWFALEPGMQPRLAVLAGIKALVVALEAAGIVSGVAKQLEEAGKWAQNQLESWTPAVPSDQNPAKQLAQSLFGSPVVIYGGPVLSSVAYKWKIDFNENAKNISFYDVLSELDHNEIEGWSHPVGHNIKLVELRSSLDNPQIAKRYDIGDKLSRGLPKPLVVEAQGETVLRQMLWAQLLGDFVSVYMALLNEVDPAAVPIMEELKKELAE